MKKLFPTFILIFVLNLYLPTNAGPWPKNYYKGKFYDSVKDFFLSLMLVKKREKNF